MKFRIESELVHSAKPKRFRKGGRLHRKVRIYLTTDDPADMKKVRWAQYELHETFRDRYRISSKATSDFEIHIWTYGFFKVKGTVMLEDGTALEASGFVKW